jgi:hypothetical protein
MTVQQAILIGAAIIAAAIVGVRALAPYEFSAEGGSIWRGNAITGDVRKCMLTGSREIWCLP